MLSMDLTERDEYFSASDEHTKKEYHHHILHDIMMFALLCSQLPFFFYHTLSHTKFELLEPIILDSHLLHHLRFVY